MTSLHSILFSVTRKLRHAPSEMSEIVSEPSETSRAIDRDEVKRRVRVWIMKIAGPHRLEKRETIWHRVARACSPISASRIADLYYGEARRIDAEEYLTIEAAARVRGDDARENLPSAGLTYPP